MSEARVVSPAYPVVSSEPEFATVDGLPGDNFAESVKCVCGNDTSSDGFGDIAPDGRFSWMNGGPAPDGLSTVSNGGDYGRAVCHACGRVYDNAALELGVGAPSPVLFRYDTASYEFRAAQALYWAALGGW